MIKTGVRCSFCRFETDWEGRRGSARPGGWRERRTFYILLLDAINRRKEQPTMVNIFSLFPLNKSYH